MDEIVENQAKVWHCVVCLPTHLAGAATMKWGKIMRTALFGTVAILAASFALSAQAVEWKGTNAQGSKVGVYSSQVKKNGPAVSDQAKSGERADEVQGILADEGRGRDK